MHGNMVFSRDSIFPTPQQSGCLCVCSVNKNELPVSMGIVMLLNSTAKVWNISFGGL